MKRIISNYNKGAGIDETFKTLSKPNQKLINDFLKYCQISSVHDKTQDKIKRKIVAFADTYERDLNQFSLDDLRELLPAINKSKKSKDYKEDLIKQIKRFLKWKFEDWSVRFKEFSDLKYIDKGEKKKKITYSDLFTIDEINFIIQSLTDIRKKTLIAVMAGSGARPEEITHSTFRSIDYKNRLINVYSHKTKRGRSIPLSEEVLGHLKRYEKECFVNPKLDDYIFPDSTGNNPMSAQTLVNTFKSIGKTLKLKKKFYPYALRHSTLQRWRLLLDPETYEKTSGHSLQVALKFYGHINEKQTREEFNKKIFQVEELSESEREEFEKMKKKLSEIEEMFKKYTPILKSLNEKF